MVLSASRFNIDHQTEIDAPIEKVWAAVTALDEWKEWNKWTTLEASSAKTGEKGKLKACYEGDEKWETFDFQFDKVSDDEHLMQWSGSVGGGLLFKGLHHMRLTSISPGKTLLEHKEVFSGLLPMLGLGLPYVKLDRNYLLMNKAIKAHVESAK